MIFTQQNIKAFISKAFYWLMILLIAFVYIKFSRYSIPDAKNLGVRDDQSIAFFVYAFLLFAAALPTLISRILMCVTAIGLSFYAILNWWFYDFYRDFITFSIYKLALYTEETSMAWSGLKYKPEAGLFLILITALLVIVFYWSAHKPKPSRNSLLIVSLCFLLIAIQHQYEISQRDMGGLKHQGINPVSYFIKSIFPKPKTEITQKHIDIINRALKRNNKIVDDQKYPLYQAVKSTQNSNGKNIILVFLESVRAFETGLDTSSSNTISLTPNLDKLAIDSINFSQFYANTNQTVKAEVAVLCSALDYINGAPYSIAGKALPTNCIPSILKKNGYQTYWFHGYDQEFFNRREFFPTLGYEHIHDQSVINKSNDKTIIGWGISDEDVYDHALKALEKEQGPFFAEILTLSNHYPYLWDWGDVEFPKALQQKVSEGENIYPAYQRGIYYTDFALGKFIKSFKKSSVYDNTLLLIVGDHGIWTFPEKEANDTSHFVELIKNEKYFRVPLLLHAKDLAANSIQTPVSQIDIAPTILDYLDVSYPNAFLGQSLINQNLADKPVYFLTSGTYGYRENNNFCYPIDKSGLCGKYNRNCKSFKKGNFKSVCVKTDLDLFDINDQVELIEIDQSNAKAFIDLSQHFLNYGYMPEHSLINKPLSLNPQ